MHTDPELLGLLALGEHEGTEDDRRHAQTCPQCAAELSDLQRLASLARSVSTETTMATPSQDVWALICEELGFDVELSAVAPSVDAGLDDRLTAHARLRPVEASWSGASGEAELATDEHGRRLLRVALQADLPSSGVRQAWLVHRDDPSLRQTLGILDGPHGLWTVAHSIDLEKYAILDISQQDTGETEHSGQTIVRGELTLAS